MLVHGKRPGDHMVTVVLSLWGPGKVKRHYCDYRKTLWVPSEGAVEVKSGIRGGLTLPVRLKVTHLTQ